LDHFLGNFRIFRGKGTPDYKNDKFYLLVILTPHKYRQVFLSKVFPELLSLEDDKFN
jgi:hypothetical protein